MSITAGAEDLARAYEALRALAVGTIPMVRPRGAAVLRRAGMVAWLRALPPGSGGRRCGRSSADRGTTLVGLEGELVSVLTEMALRAGTGSCHAS